MSKINLTSNEWNNLVFEGRNKKYGAYDMRKNSNNRHIKALVIVLALALFAFFLPKLVKTIIPKKLEEELKMTEVTALSNLPPAETPPEEVKPMYEELLPPPPPLKSTIKFTAPVIKKDHEVAEEHEIKDQQEVIKSDLQISIADVKGTNEKDGKDIAELKEVIQAPAVAKDTTFVTVEQMPQYPGGEAEMRKYIAKTLKYPRVAEENGIEGRVTVRFVVTKTGDVNGVEVIKGVDQYLDKEAVRVIASMPKWIPGKQNGISVNVYYVAPIVFKMN